MRGMRSEGPSSSCRRALSVRARSGAGRRRRCATLTCGKLRWRASRKRARCQRATTPEFSQAITLRTSGSRLQAASYFLFAADDEDLPEFIEETQEDILKAIGKLRGKDAQEPAAVHEAARLAARRAARRWSGKNPQVRVIMPPPQSHNGQDRKGRR